LLIMRKPDSNSVQKEKTRSVKWASYERGKTEREKIEVREPKAKKRKVTTSG